MSNVASNIGPPVQVEHLFAADDRAAEIEWRHGEYDILRAAAAALKGKLSPYRMLDVVHRHAALANFVRTHVPREWVHSLDDTTYASDEALWRAAARAPLQEANYLSEYTFDKETFLPIVLEEAEAKGRA